MKRYLIEIPPRAELSIDEIEAIVTILQIRHERQPWAEE